MQAGSNPHGAISSVDARRWLAACLVPEAGEAEEVVACRRTFAEAFLPTDDAAASVELLVHAAVATCIQARHLWAVGGGRLLPPASSPWYLQAAVKRLRAVADAASAPEALAGGGLEEFLRNLQMASIEAERLAPSSPADAAPAAPPYLAVRADTKGDGVDGALVLAAPAPSGAELVRVPARDLFNIFTVAEFSPLGRVLTQPPFAATFGDDDEAILVFCLIYERFVRGAASHWHDRFFATCPHEFSHLPVFWDEAPLQLIDGICLDQVAEKLEATERFLTQGGSFIAVVGKSHSDLWEGAVAGTAASWLTKERAQWARCVFDSRAFILKYPAATAAACPVGGGRQERLTLAPTADMLNHTAHSDVLTRRIDADNGDLVMCGGAAMHAVGREVFLCYGPLETWELLLSYGFVPEGTEGGGNIYDTFPLPLAYDEDAAETDPLHPRRLDVLRRTGLLAVHNASLCLPVTGEIPPAVKAVVRAWQAQSEAELEQIAAAPYAAASDETTEAGVTQLLEMGVGLMLDTLPELVPEDVPATCEAIHALRVRNTLRNIGIRAQKLLASNTAQ